MESTLEKIYKLYEQKMYWVAYDIVHSEEQAEDIVQEAFIKIFSNINKIEDVDSVITKRWVLRITKNEAINHYWRNKRKWNLDNIVKKEQSTVQYDNVDNKIQQMMQEEYVQELFDRLSHTEKEILQYKIIYELSTTEIAEMLGITEDGVRKRYNRAKRKAKELIGGINDEK